MKVHIPDSLQKLIDAGTVRFTEETVDGLEFAIDGLPLYAPPHKQIWTTLFLYPDGTALIEENDRDLGPSDKWDGPADEAADAIEIALKGDDP